ncbi:MAG: CehA/McbA family metallohydrolase [Chloroflexi bacterium]|nr:CehA/McbA family metallohydrolase [Chloroflexota bacterium]
MSRLSLNHVRNPAAGWYSGDFHAHTNCSDGHYGAAEVAALTIQRGLDFFAITDHNTINSFDQFGDDPGILVIPGIEVTLTTGHWNVFGMEGTPSEAWQGWMEGVCGPHIAIKLPKGRTTTSIMAEIAAGGLFNSINHPFLTPWAWEELHTSMAHVHFLEVWNDHLWPDNRRATPAALDYWTAYLNAGLRLTAIGGSDFHFLPGDHKSWPGEYMGMPTTWVYADQLSGAAILEGVRQGRAYVSIRPRIAFEAQHGGNTYGIGADLGAPGGEIAFSAALTDVEDGDLARLVQNGQAIASAVASDGQISLEKRLLPAGSVNWWRVDVFNAAGELLAFSNPIFAAQPSHTPREYGDYLSAA